MVSHAIFNRYYDMVDPTILQPNFFTWVWLSISFQLQESMVTNTGQLEDICTVSDIRSLSTHSIDRVRQRYCSSGV